MSLRRGQKLPVRKIPTRARSTNLDLTKLTPEELERWRRRVAAAEWLRAEDLILLGYVDTRMALHRRIQAGEFPDGHFISTRCKRWHRPELDRWRERVLKGPKPKWDHSTLTAKPA